MGLSRTQNFLFPGPEQSQKTYRLDSLCKQVRVPKGGNVRIVLGRSYQALPAWEGGGPCVGCTGWESSLYDSARSEAAFRPPGQGRRGETRRGVQVPGFMTRTPPPHARTHARARARAHTHTHTHTRTHTHAHTPPPHTTTAHHHPPNANHEPRHSMRARREAREKEKTTGAAGRVEGVTPPPLNYNP